MRHVLVWVWLWKSGCDHHLLDRSETVTKLWMRRGQTCWTRSQQSITRLMIEHNSRRNNWLQASSYDWGTTGRQQNYLGLSLMCVVLAKLYIQIILELSFGDSECCVQRYQNPCNFSLNKLSSSMMRKLKSWNANKMTRWQDDKMTRWHDNMTTWWNDDNSRRFRVHMPQVWNPL